MQYPSIQDNSNVHFMILEKLQLFKDIAESVYSPLPRHVFRKDSWRQKRKEKIDI